MEKKTVSIAEYEALKAKYLLLELELANLKKLIFGSKTERYISKKSDPDQGRLFPAPEVEAPAPVSQKKKPAVSKKSKQKKSQRFP